MDGGGRVSVEQSGCHLHTDESSYWHAEPGLEYGDSRSGRVAR